MAEPSAVYQGRTPSLENGALNPLQLALANYMAIGNPPPFAINNAFMETMKTYTDPGELSPFDINPTTGLPRVPDLLYNITEGVAYIARGEDIYLLRRAQDCGPDENRLEEVYLGRRPDVAAGTFAFYGFVVGGSIINTYDNGGGYGPDGIITTTTTTIDKSLDAIGSPENFGQGGPADDGGPAGAGPDGAKLVCTMMNRLYGFRPVSHRNRLWMRWNKLEKRDKSWQQAYHKLFVPFVEKMPTNKIIRTVLEDWANTRTQMIKDKLHKKPISKKALMYLVIIRPLVFITAWGIRKGYIQPVSDKRIEKLSTISIKDIK